MKFVAFFAILLFPIWLYSQVSGQPAPTRYKNFNRPRAFNDNLLRTSFFDTLLKTADTYVSRMILVNTADALSGETTIVNGRKNGISVEFWPNGVVKTVKFYFQDKLWDVISVTDHRVNCLIPAPLPMVMEL